ncbi:hypothetical protein GC207_12435 [bacterium]|nr:hypothetical protein [bacterium]
MSNCTDHQPVHPTHSTETTSTHGRTTRAGSQARKFLVGIALAVVGLLMVLATGCQHDPKVLGYTEGPYDTPYVLPGDVLFISFPGATNLSAQVKVTADGEVRLPSGFGKPINSTGKTRPELEKALIEEFGKQLRTPEVNVSLIQSAAVVYVSGAVMAPATIPMSRPLTLLEAIMQVGGPNMQKAKLDSVSVVRNFQGEQRTYKVDMSKAFAGGDVVPFYLRPFDSIVVPTRVFNF